MKWKKDRRESISTMHTQMFKQLLDAEADHEQSVKTSQVEIKELKQRIKYLELENSTIKQESSPMSTTTLNQEEVQSLKKEMKESKKDATETQKLQRSL